MLPLPVEILLCSLASIPGLIVVAILVNVVAANLIDRAKR